MTRRPAVTLMEVLIAMFIMAIGMLALLALFPVGAVSMAQALKDDRCAYASYIAENVAIANNLRYGDLLVNTALNNPAGTGLVYVDAYAAQQIAVQPALGFVGGSLIPRVNPSFTPTLVLADRWLSLPDDITFYQSGYPDVSSGFIDRGRRYSIAYLLRRQVPLSVNPNPVPVQLYAVVYAGRPVNSLATTTTEWPLTLTVQGVVGTNGVQVNGVGTTLKRGGWILEPANGYFYRVTNLAENNLLGTTTVEIQQNLVGVLPITTVIAMDHVAEVFDKGFGWQQ